MPENLWSPQESTPTTLAHEFAPVGAESSDPYYGPTLLGFGTPGVATRQIAGGGAVAVVGAGDAIASDVVDGGSSLLVQGGGDALAANPIGGGGAVVLGAGGQASSGIGAAGGGAIALLGGGTLEGPAIVAASGSGMAGIGPPRLVRFWERRDARDPIAELAVLLVDGGATLAVHGGGACQCGRVARLARSAGRLRLAGGGDVDTRIAEEELVVAILMAA